MNRVCLVISVLLWLLVACGRGATPTPTAIPPPGAEPSPSATLPTSVTSAPTSAPQAPSAAGSVARYDPQRSGRSPYSGPEQPWLKWLNQDFNMESQAMAVGAHATVSPDGTIYAISSDGALFAVGAGGGTKWKLDLRASSYHPPAVAADGTVYTGSRDGNLYAVTPAGGEKWRFAAESPIISSPLIDPQGNIYFGVEDSTLFSLSPDGQKNWEFAPEFRGTKPPSRLQIVPGLLAMATDGTIYYALPYGFWAIEPDGNQRWNLHIALDELGGHPAVGPDGTVYLTLQRGELAAVSPEGEVTWRFYAEGDVRGSPAVGSDGTIYFLSNDMNLYALTPDGTLKWRFDAQGYRDGSPSVDTNGNILFATSSRLYMVGPDGDLKWYYERGDVRPAGPPIIGPDATIYVMGEQGLLAVSSVPQAVLSRQTEAVEAALWPQFQRDAQHSGRYPYSGIASQLRVEEPKVKWSFLGSPTSALVVAPNDTIYFGSREQNKVLALREDGGSLWSFNPEGAFWQHLALAGDGTIYSGGRDKNLYALNPDGTLKWQYEVGEAIATPLTVAPDGTIYFLTEGYETVTLWSMGPDGNPKWQLASVAEAGPSIISCPAIAPNGTIYFGSSHKDGPRVYAVNADGTLEWELTLQDYTGRIGPPAIAPDGTVYISTEVPSRLLAISPEGSVKWESDIQPVQNLGPSPVSVTIGQDGTLYIGGGAHGGHSSFSALTPEGNVKWMFPLPRMDAASTSALIGSDGTIYFGSLAGGHEPSVYALREDGSLKWEYQVHSTVYGLAIGSDGTIYAASEDGNLYAISSVPVSEKALAVTPPEVPKPASASDLPLEIQEWSIVPGAFGPNLRVTFKTHPGDVWRLIDPDGNRCDSQFPSSRIAEFKMAQGTPLSGKYTLTSEKVGEAIASFDFDFEGPDVSLVGIKIAGFAYVELENNGDLPMYVSEIHVRRSGTESWISFFASDPAHVMPGERTVISGHVLSASQYYYYEPGEQVEVKLRGWVAGEMMEVLTGEAVLGQPLTKGEG